MLLSRAPKCDDGSPGPIPLLLSQTGGLKLIYVNRGCTGGLQAACRNARRKDAEDHLKLSARDHQWRPEDPGRHLR